MVGDLEFNDANQTEKPCTQKKQAGWLGSGNRASVWIEKPLSERKSHRDEITVWHREALAPVIVIYGVEEIGSALARFFT